MEIDFQLFAFFLMLIINFSRFIERRFRFVHRQHEKFIALNVHHRRFKKKRVSLPRIKNNENLMKLNEKILSDIWSMFE